MPEPVLEAMRQAAGSFVALETLQEPIGERLARRIGVEGALVTCGADAERVQRLPYTHGWRGWDGGMFVDPMTLQSGEAQQVAHRLREVLTGIGIAGTDSTQG